MCVSKLSFRFGQSLALVEGLLIPIRQAESGLWVDELEDIMWPCVCVCVSGVNYRARQPATV